MNLVAWAPGSPSFFVAQIQEFGLFWETGFAGEWKPEYGLFHQDKVTRCEPSEYPLMRALRGESVKQLELWIRMPDWPEGR